MSEHKQQLDISWAGIFKVFAAFVLIYLLAQVAEILVWIIFSLVISILFNPIVNLLRKMKIPRAVGVILVYSSFFGIISIASYIIGPSLYREVESFFLLLDDYLKGLAPILEQAGVGGVETVNELEEFLVSSAGEITKGIFGVLGVIFGGLSTAFFIITMAVFLSLEGNSIEKLIALLFQGKQKEQGLIIWKKCRDQVGGWFLIRVIACTFVGVASFFVFYLLGVQYALTFAIIGGILNFIPFAGPAVAGLLFFIITAVTSLPQAVFIFVAFMIIQAIEGSVLTPALSKKIMGVSPALVLASIVIGGSLWGILGAFLAIPLMGIIFEFGKAFFDKRKEWSE